MILAIYQALFVLYAGAVSVNTEFDWLSHVCIPISLVCYIIASRRYERLKQRLDDIEKRMKGGTE